MTFNESDKLKVIKDIKPKFKFEDQQAQLLIQKNSPVLSKPSNAPGIDDSQSMTSSSDDELSVISEVDPNLEESQNIFEENPFLSPSDLLSPEGKTVFNYAGSAFRN